MSDLQERIIEEMGVKPEIVPQEEIGKSMDFIRSYWREHSFLKTLVLGISGGQDSTLLGKIAQLTAEEVRSVTGDDAYQFIAVTMPYGKQQDQDDVDDALEWIAPDVVLDINIKSATDALVEEFVNQGFGISDFNKGNIKARQRMVIQYAIAGEKSGIVLGTDHAAENTVGFFTKFGDGSADLMPLFRLNKRQGRELLRELGAPNHLVEKVPTADLEDDQPLQSDEEALGVTYDHLDDYLEGKEVPEAAAERIEELYMQSQHKRHMPITIFDDFWKEE